MRLFNKGFPGPIYAKTPVHGALLAAGTTVPADGDDGYAPGCIFQQLDGSAGTVLYVNEGTVTACDFNPVVLPGVDLSTLSATAAELNLLSGLTATAAEINAIAAAGGSLHPLDRMVKCDVVAIAGAALQAANLTLWTAPADAVILRLLLDVTTVATAACTVDIGYTAASATTTSNTLLDGVDVNGAVALFDSMDAALASGANAKAQKAASGKWITADSASGDATGLVANAYVFYILA